MQLSSYRRMDWLFFEPGANERYGTTTRTGDPATLPQPLCKQPVSWTNNPVHGSKCRFTDKHVRNVKHCTWHIFSPCWSLQKLKETREFHICVISNQKMLQTWIYTDMHACIQKKKPKCYVTYHIYNEFLHKVHSRKRKMLCYVDSSNGLSPEVRVHYKLRH